MRGERMGEQPSHRLPQTQTCSFPPYEHDGDMPPHHPKRAPPGPAHQTGIAEYRAAPLLETSNHHMPTAQLLGVCTDLRPWALGGGHKGILRRNIPLRLALNRLVGTHALDMPILALERFRTSCQHSVHG
jgi:hypothetical protein